MNMMGLIRRMPVVIVAAGVVSCAVAASARPSGAAGTVRGGDLRIRKITLPSPAQIAAFRREAFLEIGGFDPALGHSGARVFFAEEDEAQRELVRRGYRVRYVPDAAVWHVIPADRLTRARRRHR